MAHYAPEIVPFLLLALVLTCLVHSRAWGRWENEHSPGGRSCSLVGVPTCSCCACTIELVEGAAVLLLMQTAFPGTTNVSVPVHVPPPTTASGTSTPAGMCLSIIVFFLSLSLSLSLSHCICVKVSVVWFVLCGSYLSCLTCEGVLWFLTQAATTIRGAG